MLRAGTGTGAVGERVDYGRGYLQEITEQVVRVRQSPTTASEASVTIAVLAAAVQTAMVELTSIAESERSE